MQLKATIALAALGENVAVVKAVLKHGNVLPELSDIRHEQPPMTDADLTDVVNALHSDNSKLYSAALQMLSISGRTDLASEARAILHKCRIDGEPAQAAIWALGSLSDTSAEAINLIVPHLRLVKNQYAAIISLFRIGTPDALEHLKKLFDELGIVPGHAHCNVLAFNLALRPQYRKSVAEVLWHAIQSNSWWRDSSSLIECLTELNEPEIRLFLIREAYEPDGAIHVVGHRESVIRTLLKIDSEAAFRACEHAFALRLKDRNLLATVLLDIDEQRAIPLLAKVFAWEDSTMVRHSIGRILRRCRSKELVREILQQMCLSDVSRHRCVSVELAGFQGPGFLESELRSIAINDDSAKVRSAAHTALRRQIRESQTLVLLNSFKNSSGSRTWSLLDAILDSADPILLRTQRDPVYLRDYMPADKQYCWLWIRDRLKKRVEELEKEAEKLDENED